jgi:molecular chaperone DnaJ
MTLAALGGQVEIPTLHGTIRLTVPGGTQPGSVLRVRGKGISHRLRSGRGDQLVEINVEIPGKLSDRGRKLLEALAEELENSQELRERSLVDKLKELFE